MHVNNVENVNINLSGRECIDIAIYLKRVVQDTAKNNHLEWYLKDNAEHSAEGFLKYLNEIGKEQFYIDAIKTLSSVGGSPQHYDDLYYVIKQTYENGVKEVNKL